jgi:cytochrome c peroxidase
VVVRAHCLRPLHGIGLLVMMGLTCVATSAQPPPNARAPLSPIAQLGKALFFDKSLSSSGQLACASCHDPQYAYGPPPGAGPVMFGGRSMHRAGLRSVPSLRYLQNRPHFTRHEYLASSDDPEDVGPGGGFMWDGRADDLAAQALIPLLDAREMANRDVHELATRLRASAEAAQFRRLYGPAALHDDARAAARASKAITRFELDDASFHPYDSRYDRYLRGTQSLSAQELRGLALFESAQKGNCADCHPNAPGPQGAPPAFSDYRFVALGVPRNPALPANRDADFYDLGLCGPLRGELVKESTEYCGLFKTPTLRNVALRSYFFHNARFTTLEQVLQFYVQRDLAPERWYPTQAGRVELYDDLPPAHRANVDRADPPFDRGPGEPPALDAQEMADLIAFLRTLTDRS